MGLVVSLEGVGLAVGAEVRVMADSTLVAIASDIRLVSRSSAQRAITVDATVNLLTAV